MKNILTKHRYVAVMVLVCATMLLAHPAKTFALYTTAQIDARLADGTATAVTMDTRCRNHVLGNIGIAGGPLLRDSINGAGAYLAASYDEEAWLSGRGLPNIQSPTPVAWGALSVPLQINDFVFICGTLVAPETYAPVPSVAKNPASMTLYNQASRWVLSAANANDRAPNPIGTTNMRPARTDTQTKITRYTVLSGTPGGSVTGGIGQTISILRNNNSRYWFPTAAPINVTYNAPGGITQPVTIKVRMWYRYIQGYHALSGPTRVESCAGQAQANNLNIDLCDEQFTDLTITFAPNASLAATTLVNPATVPLGGTTNFTHTITKSGPGNANYVWRVCFGVYAAPTTTPGLGCTGYAAASNTSTRVRPYTAVSPADVGKYYCERILYAVNVATGDAGGSSGKCVQITPLASSCGSLDITPNAIDPFTQFSITVGATNAANATDLRDTMQLRLIPIAASGTTWSYTSPVTPVGAAYPASVTFGPLGPTGQTGQWQVEWIYNHFGSASLTCGYSIDTTAVLNVANKPFLHVYGGDVSAGIAVKGKTTDASQVCTTNVLGGVYSWNNRDAGFSGAGAQYAVLALDQIMDFSSASENAAGANGTPEGLSFANAAIPAPQLDATQGMFGGSFGGTSGACDFVSDIAGGPTNTASTENIGARTVGIGASDVHYVVGQDVYISGNILYAGTGGWASLDQIPYFKVVVVGGNIYVDHNVTDLSGIYVAEQDENGNGGTIFTCATGAGAEAKPLNAGYYDLCKQKLTIHGAFAAQQIQFLRTLGTVGNSAADTWRINNAAEVFDYSPEVWLPRSSIVKIGNSYDAITGLPPVL